MVRWSPCRKLMNRVLLLLHLHLLRSEYWPGRGLYWWKCPLLSVCLLFPGLFQGKNPETRSGQSVSWRISQIIASNRIVTVGEMSNRVRRGGGAGNGGSPPGAGLMEHDLGACLGSLHWKMSGINGSAKVISVFACRLEFYMDKLICQCASQVTFKKYNVPVPDDNNQWKSIIDFNQ